MSSATKNNALLARWADTLNRCGSRPAIHAASGGVALTFSDIENESLRFAEELDVFTSGSVVAVQIGNSAHWPALLLAMMRRGLVPLPLGLHMEHAERETAFTACGAAGVAGLCGGEVIFSTRAGSISPPDCDFLKLTSGTTSAPRAILFRAHQLVADCDNVCDTMGISSADINFGVIPFSHSYGFSNLVTPLLCRGVPLVASEDTIPRAILKNIEGSGATVFPGTPALYQAFAGMENVPPLPRLRLCISAGAPLSRSVAEQFSAKFRRKIHTFYGASECGGIGYDGSESPGYEDGFLGAPMKNVRIETRGDSTIEIRSGAVGEGYFPAPEPAALDGVRFIPGDLVRKTEQGMYLVGRVAEVINVAGRKLNPMEVEAKLQDFPGVKQVVVFGVPSAHRNECAIACVSGSLNTAEFLRFAQSVLSPWQVPKDVWLVDEIPANERGKISRRELSQRYLAGSRQVE
jgi:acyl-CoA synthetase (AMP-forming)/AMP-acid ligase II